MSDHDRGAYTPNNDAPLSFDARQSRGRRAFPTTLIISLLVLIGLGAAIFMFYRSGVRGAGEAPTPVGTPVGEIKSPPTAAQAQSSQEAGQGLTIYKTEGNAEAPASSAPAATGFAPPPEQPQARPAAPVAAQPIAPAKPAPTAVVAAPAPVATPPVQVAQAKPAPATVQAAPVAKPAPVPAKPVVAASKPAPKDEVGALLDSSKPAKAEAKTAAAKPAPAAAKAEAPVSNVAHGAAVVQFGAFSSSELASSEWAKLAKAYPTEMSGKGKLVESVDRDGKTLFRGAVSGFASRPDAVAFCAKLKADSKACIVR